MTNDEWERQVAERDAEPEPDDPYDWQIPPCDTGRVYVCSVCRHVGINPHAGEDTCPDCSRRI